VKHSQSDGFTLVELLIAMFIMVIVFGAVSASFALSLRSSDESTQRLAESQDADFTDSYFTKDAQSADTVSSTTANCGSGTGPVIVAFSWSDTSATKNVTYQLGTGAQSSQLTRYACDGGTVTSVQVVASELASPPTVTCVPTTCLASTQITMQIAVKTGAIFIFRGSPRKSR
jgi:prepilin-type N-terminal cleavage/methylation domain-containing protein